jgi:protein gp37
MSATSSIEWTDRTWNPVRGCSVISPGCTNCYAMKQAHRFSGEGRAYFGLTKQTKAGPQWTGQIRCVDSALEEPLRWRTPSRIFVNSMSDLFHEDVPFDFVDRVFAVMTLAPQHTFQILTKRAERMRDYIRGIDGSAERAEDLNRAACAVADGLSERFCRSYALSVDTGLQRAGWPLPNVWLGVSVENQKYADERIPLLQQTLAAIRFISYEPALGPINIGPFVTEAAHAVFRMLSRHYGKDGFDPTGSQPETTLRVKQSHGLHWVIVGGESGSGARPFDVAWARSIVQQCKAAGVACFVKQLGANPEWQQGCGDCDPCIGGAPCPQGYNIRMELHDKKGGDPSEWPEDLHVRQFPEIRA